MDQSVGGLLSTSTTASNDPHHTSLTPTQSRTSIHGKLSPYLLTHLNGVELGPLLRIPLPRLETTALPQISTIELVSGPDFAQYYDDLYVASFPKRTEREASGLIVERLEAEFANERPNLAPYRIVGLRDHKDHAIGAAQFCLLLLKGQGAAYAVPYLQYLYVRAANRRQNMAELLHTLVLAVAEADGKRAGGRSVPFTLFETDPAGHGGTEAAKANSRTRIGIHTRSGGLALVLKDITDPTMHTSSHVQPGLEGDDPPLTLLWAIRPSPALAGTVSSTSTSTSTSTSISTPSSSPNSFSPSTQASSRVTSEVIVSNIPNAGANTTSNSNIIPTSLSYSIKDIGKPLIEAYYQSIRDEGFAEANIALAERIAVSRYRGREFALIPLEDATPFIGDMSATET